MKGFVMSLEVAEKFFQRCIDKEAVTEKERLAVMNELIHEEKIKILKENQIADTLRGKNVLRVKSTRK